MPPFSRQVEFSDYCQTVIKTRMSEGLIPKADVIKDVKNFDASKCTSAKVLVAGFPCQEATLNLCL